MKRNKKQEINPVIEIMKHCDLWKFRYILFILFWVSYGVVDILSNYFMGGLIDVAGKDNDYFFKLVFILLICVLYSYLFTVSDY